MLDSAIKEQLATYLGKLVQPIELVAALDGSDTAHDMRVMLDEIAALSGQVRVRDEADAGVRRPSFGVARPGEPARIRFAGIPLGHEFTSLVLALLWVGGHPPKVDAALLQQVAAVDGEFAFESFVSLSCQTCPDVVQALNLMAAINPRIRHTMIDGAAFPDEAEARQVLAVPAVFLDGQPFSQGRITLEEILAKIDRGAETRRAAELATKDAFDVLVVGGGPAGASAAIYAARKGVRTGVAAERFGGQVLDTVGIENFISVQATEGPKLAAALEAHVRQYGVDIMNGQRATALVPADRSGDGLVHVQLANGAALRSKSVILATGARWREMNVPGEREYRGRGVAYCPHCDGPLFKGKKVAVIGGGNSGIEAAIDLAGIVEHVTVLEFDSALRADAVLQQKLYSLPNVTVILSAQTTEVSGDGQKMTGLTYKDRVSGELHQLALAGVFVQIGLVPNTDWLKGTVALSNRGEIVIGERGETSVAGVFAAGDCSTVPFKQIIIAMGEGAKAALGAFDHLVRLPAAAGKAA